MKKAWAALDCVPLPALQVALTFPIGALAAAAESGVLPPPTVLSNGLLVWKAGDLRGVLPAVSDA